MLRVSLTRPLTRRYFSSTSLVLNAARLPKHDNRSDSEAEPASSLPSPQTATEPTQLETSAKNTGNQPPSAAHNSLESAKHRVRDWAIQTGVTLRARADDLTIKSKTTFSQLGSQLNKFTGYEAIEDLKQEVVDQEARINATRQAARQAKRTYEESVSQRSNSQRQVNEFLQRKPYWTDSDLAQFTEIVRQDHVFQQEEARSKTTMSELDDALEREFSQLMRTILARYHEEQVWSDKIRSVSTYGSLAVLGLNMLVFILAIVVVEPWKRRRLARTFERKVEELERDNQARLDASMAQIGMQLENQEMLILELSQASKIFDATPSKEPAMLATVDAGVNGTKEAKTERTSDRFTLRQDTLTLVAVGASAFVGGLVSSLWLGH